MVTSVYDSTNGNFLVRLIKSHIIGFPCKVERCFWSDLSFFFFSTKDILWKHNSFVQVCSQPTNAERNNGRVPAVWQQRHSCECILRPLHNAVCLALVHDTSAEMPRNWFKMRQTTRLLFLQRSAPDNFGGPWEEIEMLLSLCGSAYVMMT